MDSRIEGIFNESILLERKVAALYRLFSRLFSEDAGFWSVIALEEENHAVLLQSGKDSLFEAGLFPIEALDQDLDEIRRTNADLDETISIYKEKPPSRREAFDYAIAIENSAGEICFQRTLSLKKDSYAVELFKNLADDGCDHKNRIIEQFNKLAKAA